MVEPLFGIATRLILGTTPPVVLDNFSGDGLRVEWTVTKTRTSAPDKATITVFNFAVALRKAISAFVALPIPLLIQLFIGWQVPEQLFTGQAWKIVAEKRTPTDVLTILECGDGVKPLKDTPPAGGATFGIGIQLATSRILGTMGLRPSLPTLGVIASRAAAIPLQSFQFVATGEPTEDLDQLMASIGLAWGIQGGEFVVFDGGLKPGVPTILSPLTGLLEWTEVDDGGIEFMALAQPRVDGGSQIVITDPFGVTLGGGPLRVETVEFSGASEGPSTMRGVARKVQVL